jgi:hypothetical protein
MDDLPIVQMESPMMPLSRSISVLGMVIATQANAASAPDALKGKSVVLTWTETRQQRNVGEPSFYSVNASRSLSIYVSTAGRVFSRATSSTRSGSGTIEQAPGEGGGAYPTRTALFGGQTMTLIGETKGGARRTLIEFDASFASCSARVALAFQSGKTSVSLSLITKKYVEIKSVTMSGTSCSVKSGNVLAGAT